MNGCGPRLWRHTARPADNLINAKAHSGRRCRSGTGHKCVAAQHAESQDKTIMLAAKAMGYDSRPMIGFGRPNDRGGFCPRKTLEKAAA